MDTIAVVKSNKGIKDKLLVNGYSYHFERETKQKTINWSCAYRRKYFCRGRVVTRVSQDGHTITKRGAEHSHEPNPFDKDVFVANNFVKTAATQMTLQPSQIVRDSIVATPISARMHLPSNNAQKIKISRIRADRIREPRSLEDINIPLSLYVMEGELFILEEKDVAMDKIIILGTKSSLKLLSEADCWMADGTFYVVPSMFRQLYSIHGRIEGQVVPLVFCLMTKKSQNLYNHFFECLTTIAQNYGLELNPQRIICDFEKAARESLRLFFPQAAIKGCMFHFGQNIWRQIQKYGFVQKYGNSKKFGLQMRMLKSLAFVPPDDVPEYFRSIYLSLGNEDEDAKCVANWFQKFYIDGGDAGQPPTFDPDFWTVATSRRQCFPRTQNNVEAWHRRLKVVVGKRNAGLYKIIKDLRKELIYAKTQIHRAQHGANIRMSKELIAKNKKIKKLLCKRIAISNLEFLTRVANFTMLN